MSAFSKRRALYFLSITSLMIIAVLLKEVWHQGGSMAFFYFGALIFGALLFSVGFLILFFPNRLIHFFGGVRFEARPVWQRMEVISMGLTMMLVGGAVLALMIYRFISE